MHSRVQAQARSTISKQPAETYDIKQQQFAAFGTNSAYTMFVIKRDGRKEQVHFDKITARIMKLSYGLNTDFCDPVRSRSIHAARFCTWALPYTHRP